MSNYLGCCMKRIKLHVRWPSLLYSSLYRSFYHGNNCLRFVVSKGRNTNIRIVPKHQAPEELAPPFRIRKNGKSAAQFGIFF